ncbi:hypothetical protein MICAK_2660005 [Microcystis aeruginosa PCC 9701]|uniref:Uncharacterized protein n=1 Tax=Microcystis aeruginosa PCC 9701 TaxID=721123 RepID=I4IQY8_MICAE|nr:hypothetical protein MICAK_2660005 [Microcystis aeruginosa PCC 9701]
MRSQESGVSPDEKIFTPTDERGFFPYTPHPTPSFQSGDRREFSRKKPKKGQ